ncbi:MAG TPA: glycosyltransferase family 39 protein [Caulobacteraceae bacterium]|nr:glycosyltransferase family 39 protein [Caulobacteraceae bacterium]
MSEPLRLDALARGWRGRLFAALIALIAGLPGLIALPATDRDEARYAQAASQMLESGDFIGIDFQDAALTQAPVLVHWLEAASVTLVSGTEARAIWAYRLPALLGAMLAAAACAWGAEALFGAAPALIAGGLMGAGMALSTVAAQATTDALLCGLATLSLAALARVYAASRGLELAIGWRTKLLFWLGLALAILDAGVIAPAIALSTGIALALWDRKAPWARSLGWTWGILLIGAVVGPWAVAITVRTDGAFWTDAVGARAGHWLPPGAHLLLAPVLLFPATALLPAAASEAWRGRAETGVRFAIAWLVPAWIAFELWPAKTPGATLPLCAAAAWLAAYALTKPLPAWSRWSGAGLSLLAGAALAMATVVLAAHFNGAGALGFALFAGAVAVAAGFAGAGVLLSPRGLASLGAAGVLAVTAHAVAMAGVAPRLSPFWTSATIKAALDRAGLDPRNGLTPGPVTVVGYAEPSLVFQLGTETEISDDVDDALDAIGDARPAVLEQSRIAAFAAGLAAQKLKAQPVASVDGYDYVRGQPIRLIVYRSEMPPPSNP